MIESHMQGIPEFQTLKSEGQEISPRLVPGKEDYRYYAPILTNSLCLVCHGQEERIPSAIKEAIRDRYPDDQAKNFKVGDLRGIVRVTIPLSELGTP